MRTGFVIASGQSLIDRWFRSTTGEIGTLSVPDEALLSVSGFDLQKRLQSGETTVTDEGNGQFTLGNVLVADFFAIKFVELNDGYDDVIVARASVGGTPLLRESVPQDREPISFFNETISGSDMATGDGTATFDGLALTNIAKPAIDTALLGQMNLDFLGVLWSQGEADTLTLGQPRVNGEDGFEEIYQTALSYTLDEIVNYTLNTHSEKFDLTTSSPDIYIQHIGRRGDDNPVISNGQNDIRTIQSQLASNRADIHIAGQTFDLSHPDGLHPDLAGFEDAALRLAQAVSLQSAPVAVENHTLFNVDGGAILLVQLSVVDEFNGAQFVFGPDTLELLRLETISDKAALSFAHVTPTEVSHVGDTLLFRFDAPIYGPVQYSYAFAETTHDAAQLLIGDGVLPVSPATFQADIDIPLPAFGGSQTDVDQGTVVEFSSSQHPIAARDNASGSGYIMNLGEQSQQETAPHPAASQEFVVVAYDGSTNKWFYDNNARLVEFMPTDEDLIIASIDFDSDAVVMLDEQTFKIGEVNAGYLGGDFEVFANQFYGRPNTGELDIKGSVLVVPEPIPSVFSTTIFPELGGGIAARDNAVGDGYVLYNETPLNDRIDIHSSSNPNFAAVVYDVSSNTWSYDNNARLVPFALIETDRLVAEVDFGNDEISLLLGENETIGGVSAGYQASDFVLGANIYYDRPNTGEFGISGSYFDFWI